MALKTGKRRRRRLSMTSLIDVIFLLLLFFMLSSTFSKYSEVELTAGGAGSTRSDDPVRFIKMDGPRILLNGQDLALESLTQAFTADKQQTVLISLSDQTTSQHLIDLLNTLRPLSHIRAVVLS
ncbi:biopolymer transporter ExbD [Phaeobacter gallaeciensis]|uniref:Biopolymer transporter ExbD n=2 Tax=Roseobacteraceae TaxID=2854170 RepID=A0A366X5C9_9RHOB|nr:MULTISPECIES: biopolymer transporter ExbD [Roseobacteraceae]MBT3142410.1 biopolymer transporter ExbD [Falsiruegeria litorea]MBT8169362.1 biopolymer transporter ExbD [Falsiruegeria litorea]RBW60591.1 biopolymer transporter ExbD [Phaeobacter gallaeciensis]